MAEQGNKKFTQSLHPGIENVLGLRIPQLRELAKRIAADNWRLYLDTADTYYMEERMLQGMVISAVKIADTDEYLQLVDRWVPLINSWSVCDTFDFAGKHRWVEKNKEAVWAYLEKWIVSEREYEVRFGVVMMMTHFIDNDYVDLVIAWMKRITHPAYYVRMAVAWNLSVCFVKFRDKVMPLLTGNQLHPDVRRMTIRKIMESRRVSDSDKAAIKKL